MGSIMRIIGGWNRRWKYDNDKERARRKSQSMVRKGKRKGKKEKQNTILTIFAWGID